MRLQVLLDTIIRLKRISQADLSEQIGINRSSMNRFLSGETDIRASSLIQILESLGIHLESLLENEIDRQIGKRKATSVGEALETLVREADPVTARTILDSLAKQVKGTKNPSLQQALSVISELRLELKSVRRHA